jgi:hypothetical protein
MEDFEYLKFKGLDCIGEVGITDSEEPGSWMSELRWIDTLVRMGVDKPTERAQRYLGPIRAASADGRFVFYICQCVDSKRDSHLPPSTVEPPPPLNKLCLETSLFAWDGTVASRIRIGIAQCPLCRIVYWAVVLTPKEGLPTWFTRRQIKNKTRLVNGPPRPLW